MTAEEREILSAQPSTLPLIWREANGFHFLAAAPCPFLKSDKCSVHAKRPYNCRRFACGRVDTTAEAFESEPCIPQLGMSGSRNLSERLDQSLRFKEWYRTQQRHAQRDWADAHGWRRT